MSMGGNCDVCDTRPAQHVRCSPYGAMSLAYCDVCLLLGLEPPGIVEGVATVMCGGWEHTADHVRGYPAHAISVGLTSVSNPGLVVEIAKAISTFDVPTLVDTMDRVCPACSECEGQAHHWLQPEHDPETDTTFVPCKHCDEVAQLCEECFEVPVWPVVSDKPICLDCIFDEGSIVR